MEWYIVILIVFEILLTSTRCGSPEDQPIRASTQTRNSRGEQCPATATDDIASSRPFLRQACRIFFDCPGKTALLLQIVEMQPSIPAQAPRARSIKSPADLGSGMMIRSNILPSCGSFSLTSPWTKDTLAIFLLYERFLTA